MSKYTIEELRDDIESVPTDTAYIKTLDQDNPTWCQLDPRLVDHKQFDLEICDDACQNCPVNNDCVRWFDGNKAKERSKNMAGNE